MKKFEKNNATIFESREILLKNQPLLLKYEDIVDFFTEEPNNVLIIREGEEEQEYEQIMRIRFWIPNKKIFSWILYGNDRNLKEASASGFVLRHVVWDRESDIIRIRNEGREKSLKSLPKVYSNTVYISEGNSKELIKTLEKEKYFFLNGVKLHKRKNDQEIIWRDLEYYRVFDWGSVNLVFSMERENEFLEKYIFECNEIFEYFMETEKKKVEKMVLQYNYIPEFIKEY